MNTGSVTIDDNNLTISLFSIDRRLYQIYHCLQKNKLSFKKCKHYFRRLLYLDVIANYFKVY